MPLISTTQLNNNMAKLVLLTAFLITPLFIRAQELKESYLDKLLVSQGTVKTYYSKGCETKAKYLQELVQDAAKFYENKLKDTFDINLLVLNKNDWKLMVGGPYVISDFAKDHDRIEMGINEFFQIKLNGDRTLYGKKEAFLWDFIAAHELGHYIGHRNNVTTPAWLGEFFAQYVLIGFLSEKIPEWQFSSGITNFLFKYLPLKYKSLEDLGMHYGRMDPVNYSLYETKLLDLANKIYKKRGWNFMYEYLKRYKIKPTINSKLQIDRKLIFQYYISNFREMEPEIIDDWLLGMKKTYHPFFVFLILFSIIGIIRFFDNSYSIFTDLGIETKKRFIILGVPTFSILPRLRSFDNLKNKNRLKLIMLLRPLLYVCMTLIIILLIIHH
jgi:hypothetical protein